MTQPRLHGPGFDVEPAALRGAAGSFDSEADELFELSARLDKFLSGLGPCWGTDDVGKRFETAYRPASATVLANLCALSIGLHRIAGALRSVSDNYEWADQFMCDARVGAILSSQQPNSLQRNSLSDSL